MFAVPIKFERLAVSIVIVFLVTDLLPHPALSAGVVETTLSKVQQVVTQVTN